MREVYSIYRSISFSAKKIPESVIKKISIFLILLNFYVIANVIFSPNNLNSYYQIQQRLNVTHSKLSEIINTNNEYEREIQMLKQETLDKDYLEELARKQLNYSYPDEKVIILEQTKKI